MTDINDRLDRIEQVARGILFSVQRSRENIKQTERLVRRNEIAIDRLEKNIEQDLTEGKMHRELVAVQTEEILANLRFLFQSLSKD